MKKLFAFTFTLSILFSVFIVRAESLSTDKPKCSIDGKFSVEAEISKDNSPDYSKLVQKFQAVINPITSIGQLARVELGTVYWETSQNFGSGKYGIVSNNNAYIPDDLIVMVNGVAYLDDNNNILSSSYGITQEIEDIKIYKNRMLHISANGVDLGWVHPVHLTKA